MRKIIIAVISIILVTAAALIALVLIITGPRAERITPPKSAPLVDTLPLKAADQAVQLHLTGTVTPAESIRLQARVTGEVVYLAPGFIDGGLIPAGEPILKIDAVDYELALADAQNRLESARFAYKQELGRQEVAKREWELLKTDDATELEKELALRKPHLAADEAALTAAEAALKKAEINLERTVLTAPFNALVLSRNVNIGSQATVQTDLAELVGTDAYWVMVSIPVDRLPWVTVPGSPARVASPSGAVRDGEVVKLLGSLEEKGRMARLLIEVKDPLCLQPENRNQKPLLLNEFVRVVIDGRTLKQVYAVPRSALRENSTVWMVSSDGTLDIRTADVLWRDADQVLIRDGFHDGERLIVSGISTPMDGMDVTPNEADGPPEQSGDRQEQPARP